MTIVSVISSSHRFSWLAWLAVA